MRGMGLLVIGEWTGNPIKYPTGRCGLITERTTKLTTRKYFNQRLLDADGRFARDIEYLLTAQYAVESKQVADDAREDCTEDKGSLLELSGTSKS